MHGAGISLVSLGQSLPADQDATSRVELSRGRLEPREFPESCHVRLEQFPSGMHGPSATPSQPTRGRDGAVAKTKRHSSQPTPGAQRRQRRRPAKRETERNRKGTTARPRLRLFHFHYGAVGRSQGRWVECFMQALRKAVILSTPVAVSSLPGERRDPFLLLLLVLS
jgi:hypothetical protein